MNTIHCPGCGAPLLELANYCPFCGVSRTSAEYLSADEGLEIRRAATWHKEVALSPGRANPAHLPPRPARPDPPVRKPWGHIRSRLSPTLIIWISILAFLIGGSIFGIVTTRGSGIHGDPGNPHQLALQVTPDNVSVGATVIVNGEHFTPHGKIGLTRDTSIPIQDTANVTIIEADSQGNFTDTIVITPDWEDGLHTVNAEDAFMHKVASFSIMVAGYTGSLRPAHLRVSVDTLNLGSGNQTTTTTKTILLTNIGDGLISWQANSSQSWLLLSPPRGTLSSGGQSASVMAAIDRSKLKPGSYSAQITIFSTAGNSVIPVTAAVTALVPEHNAVLQTNPALLTFTASDGSSSHSTQAITLSNPGLHPLQWQAITDANWLFVSPASASIAPSGSLTVTVSVNSSLLLPGVYNATITNVNGPQTIFVNVTIIPQCSPLVAPGQLNFASIYQQGKPIAKAISIETPQGCNTPESWKAISNASWLTVDTKHGPFPRVAINTSGLAPGVYHSSITLNSTFWTQTLPVTFILGQAPVPLVTTAPDAISFTGSSMQSAPAMQQISITNGGNTGLLHWHATAVAAGGHWLTVSPTAGTLTTHHSTSFNIKASILPTLVPGTYNGTVTIVGTDNSGHPALGSPQVIPVSLLINPTCTFTVASGSLNFTGISGQTAPLNQQTALQIDPSCTNKLNWTVTTAGSSWLSASVSGTSTPMLNVSASLAHLAANNYSGSVTITAYDSVTRQIVGIPQLVPVALTAQPACMLQNLSTTAETFTTQSGNNPVSQTFTVSVTGDCPGAVTIAPCIVSTSETGWLSVVAATTTVTSGENATFTVTVTSANLPAGQYEAMIQLSASNNGITITNTLQGIAIKLTVEDSSDPVIGIPTPASSPTPGVTPIATPTLTPTPIPSPIPSPIPVSTPVSTVTTTT